MALVPGRLAMVIREEPSRYEEGLYFLARIVQRILALSYFYNRLSKQLTSGTLRAVEYEQARFSHVAIHDSIVAHMHKLVEQKANAWNLEQLRKEWARYEHDPAFQSSMQSSIEMLKGKLENLTQYRHEKIAHQSKKVEITEFTALPNEIKYLNKIVELMDRFVDGQIPYTLHLHESGRDIDLREEFSL